MAQVIEADMQSSDTPLPVARVLGSPVVELPKDLYIPPDALEVILETFEGPLDLLLYLIKRHNLDILDIPIAEITRQYMQYIEMMNGLRLELAAEYLVMAAMLAEIKSRMLLPRPEFDQEDEGEDPRNELVRRLQEYERFKKAAEDLNALPQFGRDTYPTHVLVPVVDRPKPLPEVSLQEVLIAFSEVLKRAQMYNHHHVQMEAMSVRERMTSILERMQRESFLEFTDLFTPEEGRMGAVVTFLALLELIRESLLLIVQSEPFGTIYVRAPEYVDGSQTT